MIRHEPGIDLIELEILEEMNRGCPGCVRSEPLEKLRKKVEDRERERNKDSRGL